MRELIEDIEFHPPRNHQFLTDWMANITIDWPISRRRWYHTEIPIWYADEGRAIVTPLTSVYDAALEARTPQGGSIVLDRSTRAPLGSWAERRGDDRSRHR